MGILGTIARKASNGVKLVVQDNCGPQIGDVEKRQMLRFMGESGPGGVGRGQHSFAGLLKWLCVETTSQSMGRPQAEGSYLIIVTVVQKNGCRCHEDYCCGNS